MEAEAERQARSLALEKAYVHDVYDQIAPHFADTRYRAWPRVRQFLLDLEPCSLVADVGCGNGKYLGINPDIMMIGSDHCAALTAAARSRRNHEVLTCDNLQLPFREETFDAVLSIAVIHHFATTDRRVAAIKELTRILRIGGKVLITVWAMEQRHGRFDSQDVLVPWHEPVKSSSEDRGSSVEREVTSTTTSDDDVLVYHAYSHISDSECHHHHQHHHNHHQSSPGMSANRRRQKYRNGRGRYRSGTGSVDHHHHCSEHHPQQKLQKNSSQSSSELSSPNETCYSFVRRALQKLSSTGGTPGSPSQEASPRKSGPRPYFYRSCRKPCISDSMEFGSSGQKKLNLDSPRCDFFHQDSIDSEYQGHEKEDDVPIELRHLEGYEPCVHCGSPVREGSSFDHCERNVCAACLPIDPDPGGKKSRSLGDFLNMIPRLLRVKKCEKEPLSDLHKRISTASDPREYVVKNRDSNANGIARSKSTVSFMSRLEELMSLTASSDREEMEAMGNPNCPAGPRSKPQRLPSLTKASFMDGGDCLVTQKSLDLSTNPRRYNCPADALKKLRQEASMEGKVVTVVSLDEEKKKNNNNEEDLGETKLQNRDPGETNSPKKKKKLERTKDVTAPSPPEEPMSEAPQKEEPPDSKHLNGENNLEGHLSSYYSMPELYKFAEEQIPEGNMFNAQKQRHISFYEQAQNVLDGNNPSTESPKFSGRNDSALSCTIRERTTQYMPHQRRLVKRSLSVDTGDNSSSSHQVPRRFSASAAQGVLSSALRTYTLPRSCSRGSSVKSDTSVDSEESIVSVIPRKGNSITSDTSVDSEESCISVIQRSTSEIDTLSNQNGLRNNMSRLGSRSAQASPITVLSSQTSSAESSPPQSGKNDGRFPGTSGVIDQLVQQQLLYSAPDGTHVRHDVSEHLIRTRRCLMRPISDPRSEERFSFSSSEDSTSMPSNCRNSGRQTPKSNRGSLESEDSFGSGDKDKSEKLAFVNNSALQESLKKLELISNQKQESVKKENPEEGELSRTPSPVGPFRYITDPLITGNELTENDPMTENDSKTDGAPEVDLDENASTEHKQKSLRFNPEVTKIEESKPETANNISVSANQVFESVLRNITMLTREANRVSSPPTRKKLTPENRADTNEEKASEEKKDPSNAIDKQSNDQSNSGSSSKSTDKAPGKESDVRRSLSKLRERLESLTSNQGSMQGFDLLKNVSHTIQGIGAFRSTKEKSEVADSRSDILALEPKVSPTPMSLNDSRQSSLDESSQVTLSDESVVSAEGTSSVSDEANDTRKADDDEELQDIRFKRGLVKTDDTTGTSSSGTINALSCDINGQVGPKQSHHGRVDQHHKSTRASSFSDTELHSKKGSVRSVLRKKLRRSCVTIDEVECREVLSSEETSPSSSVSLEWNDFDRVEIESCGGSGSCCSSSNPALGACGSDRQRDDGTVESPVAETCDDVNVAESETKFNVFVDKEMCVFFETPSSSIGKSASSSSNATDFSTTSDRIRGAMQREKSDDRSSKESDSDNLSKLSDLEARSDSAFSSEDFARRTDMGSSSSSASLDMLDSIRVKLGSESDGETAAGAGSRQNWVLDNIDEIPDDDERQHGRDRNGEDCSAKSPTASTSWNGEHPSDPHNQENFLTCAADCRDMYRISFDDRSKNNMESSPQSVENGEPGQLMIQALDIHVPIQLFPPPSKEPTDILAAFVETISDLTSVFGELYPRHEGKFDDVSSDDSLEISSFERILTSSNSQSGNSKQFKRPEKEKESNSREEVENKLSAKKCNGNHLSTNHENKNGALKQKNNELVSNFVKLPPEKEEKKQNKADPKKNSKNDSTKPLREPDWKPKMGSEKQKKEKDSTQPTPPQTDHSSSEDLKPSTKPPPEKPKILNRSSQSVCLDRVRQDSLEKDDEVSSQSAPCSPRLKPRQRSLEEVLSSSKAELSRNSSLSQSTSQESLPGQESGGAMAYHRYYHVFRQGELDSLIENHVENLHIISSYYDHANWCVIAEKVQVWTI